MDPKIKKLWVAALRSGKYKQGENMLRDVNRNNFCCLGVLCDLHARKTKLGHWNGFIYKTEEYEDGYGLPVPVQKWAGLNSCAPNVCVGPVKAKKYGDLISINDGGEHSFKRIANLIERDL